MYQNTHSSSTEPIQILTFIGAGRMYFQLGVGFNNNQDIIKIDMKANTGEVTITSQTFQNMKNLEEFIFPPNVIKIGVSVFLNDFKLTSISIPRPVSYIDIFCFENCVDLKTVRFENGLNQFGNQLFEGCTSLEFIISTAPPIFQLMHLYFQQFHSCQSSLFLCTKEIHFLMLKTFKRYWMTRATFRHQWLLAHLLHHLY